MGHGNAEKWLFGCLCGGGVEPLVVGPPHVVVEVVPQLLDRGAVVPVRELLLRRLVRVLSLIHISEPTRH